jgi:hypothetical protein
MSKASPLKLYKGNVITGRDDGRWSAHDQKDRSIRELIVTFEDDHGAYDQKDA